MEDSLVKLNKLKEYVELEKKIRDICEFYFDNIDICKTLKEGVHSEDLIGTYFYSDTEANRFLEMCSLIRGLIYKNNAISKDSKEAGELSIHKEENKDIVHVKYNSANVSGARVWIIAFKGDKSYVIPLEEESEGKYIPKSDVPAYTYLVMHARWENQGRILRGVSLEKKIRSPPPPPPPPPPSPEDIRIVKDEAEKKAIIGVSDLIGIYFKEREDVENIFRWIDNNEDGFKLFETEDEMKLVNVRTAKHNEELKSELRGKILEKIKEVYSLLPEDILSKKLSSEEIKDIVNEALGMRVAEDQAAELFKIILGDEKNIKINDKEIEYTLTKEDLLELRK